MGKTCITCSEFSFMLKPSPLGGIGVFATHDIPAGTIWFYPNSEKRKMKIKDVPALLRQYCIYINDDECLCPRRFDHMEIGWYLNHSSTPNVARKDAPLDSKQQAAYAIYDIKTGEEILIDYNSLEEPEHLKEEFYAKKTSK